MAASRWNFRPGIFDAESSTIDWAACGAQLFTGLLQLEPPRMGMIDVEGAPHAAVAKLEEQDVALRCRERGAEA
jgi:hypothetical protein